MKYYVVHLILLLTVLSFNCRDYMYIYTPFSNEMKLIYEICFNEVYYV